MFIGGSGDGVQHLLFLASTQMTQGLWVEKEED
jgi:hypothetical protein